MLIQNICSKKFVLLFFLVTKRPTGMSIHALKQQQENKLFFRSILLSMESVFPLNNSYILLEGGLDRRHFSFLSSEASLGV